jgi:predicted nucleotidyltransferase
MAHGAAGDATAMSPPTHTKDEALGRLRESSDRIRACGVRRLDLFGSILRDEVTPESDVDLMVEFEPGAKSYDNFLRLSLLLEDILGRRVELLTRESLSPYIGPRILEEAENVALGA